jgi:hypothetical protein
MLAGLVPIAVGAFVLWPRSQSRVTEESFSRVKKGMTFAEVEALLGPWGNYRTGPTTDGTAYLWSPSGRCPPGMPSTDLPDGSLGLGWELDTAEVVVWVKPPDDLGPEAFDSDRFASLEVISARYSNMKLVEQTFLDNLLWRASQWRKWFPER